MFDKLIAAVETVVADVEAGNYVQALQDAIPIVQEAAAGLAPILAPAPGECDKLQACCDKLQACCDKELAKKGGDVGVIGDGTILKNILAFLAQILPLIAPFLKPTPAPAA